MIRLALITDFIAVKDCAKAAFEPYVEKIGKEPAPMQADFITPIQNEQVYVLCQLNTVVAYVVFYQQDDYVLLENIAVQPAHAGQGYGQQLIGFVEQKTSEWELPNIELYTNAQMEKSINLYKYLGYKEIDRRTEDGFDRLYFRKAITTASS